MLPHETAAGPATTEEWRLSFATAPRKMDESVSYKRELMQCAVGAAGPIWCSVEYAAMASGCATRMFFRDWWPLLNAELAKLRATEAPFGEARVIWDWLSGTRPVAEIAAKLVADRAAVAA